MNAHEKITELLPFYAAGSLDKNQEATVETHLADCPQCRADLALWQAVNGEIQQAKRAVQPPADAVERAMHTLKSRRAPRRSLASALHSSALILHRQAPLVRREIWPASLLVLALGFVIAVIIEDAAFFQALAPLVAAACMSVLYGPENDPGLELMLSTPTSPWQVLLARLALVFGYNLALALVASLGLHAILPVQFLGGMILNWLAPMAFLSALALVLSLIIGTGNAVAASSLLWLLRWPGSLDELPMRSAIFETLLHGYNAFWTNPALLLGLAAGLIGLGVWLVRRGSLGFLKLA